MKRLLTFLRTFWPVLFLLVIELLIFAANYIPGTFLMGWDNVMPEFNFTLNLKRQLASVWQEYRGVGHLDGMAHGANLFHTLFLWVLSFIVPQSMLRYVFHFGAHFLGTLGMYLLLRTLLKENTTQKKTIPFIGALFYQLNFITIQMFYAPLEAFSVHYGALPWEILTLWWYLERSSRRRLVAYISTLLIVTPQYFVATLLVPTFVTLSAVAATLLYTRKTTVRKVFIAGAVFVLLNSFWLLPYVLGAFSNAPVIAGAKINQMSSEDIFLRNKSFGDLKNVLLLRGFSLDYLDLGANNASTWMMAGWRNHIFQPIVTLISSVIAGVTIFGLYKTLIKRKNTVPTMLYPFVAIFMLGIVMLANNTPFLKDVNEVLRSSIPFFGEAFRIPFTKFSLVFVLSYTIFFTYGILILTQLSTKILPKIRWVTYISIASLIWMAFPVFQGQFFYEQLQVKLPQEYLQVFSYFKDHTDQSKIALLPAFDYWNWKYYRWGYRGSGFLWHGIPAATLDRAFDPWSGYNETFYWELSHAIYSKDVEQLVNVLQKYQVSEILFDGTVVSAGNTRALFGQEILTMLSDDAFEKKQSFGEMIIYELKNAPALVQTSEALPKVYPAVPTMNDDRAFATLGTYASVETLSDSDVVYPFRTFATQNASNGRAFAIKEDAKTFAFTSPFIQDNKGFPIQSAEYEKEETIVFDSTKSKTLSSQIKDCNEFALGTTDAANMSLGDKTWLRMTAENHSNCLTFSMGDQTHSQGYLVAVDSRNIAGRSLKFGVINRTAKHVELEEMLPSSLDWEKTYFVLPPLAGDGLGYDVYITNSGVAQTATNDLSTIAVYEFPYEELLNFRMPQQKTVPEAKPKNTITKKIFSGLYSVTIDPAEKNILFYQAFHPQWKAFERIETFPFVSPINTHMLINNWANGWEIESCELLVVGCEEGRTIYLFFVPQIAQWIGYVLLLLPIIGLVRRKKHTH